MTQLFFSKDQSDAKFNMQRREFMKHGLVGLLGALTPLSMVSEAVAGKNTAWRVSFHHAHTGESFSGVYRVGNKYLPEAFERLNYVMRDFRTGEVFPMDPQVIDILAISQYKSRQKKPMEILSGYRSPKTNAMLGRTTSGVASNSFHMYGQAIDVRQPGCSTKKLRNIAREIKGGGVGYYPRSGFVHVDTGTVRTWTS